VWGEELIPTLTVAVIGGNNSWNDYIQNKIKNNEYIYLLLFYYFLRILKEYMYIYIKLFILAKFIITNDIK